MGTCRWVAPEFPEGRTHNLILERQLWSPAFLLDGTYHSHDGIALSSAVSADGTFIYTGGNDGTMKIWQIGSGNQTIVQSDALEGNAQHLSRTGFPE